MFKPKISVIKTVFSKKGYIFFDGKKPYDLNIIGIRSSSEEVNLFNDTLMVIYRDELMEQKATYFPYTTKPGLYYLENPLHPNGCAILKEGQHLSAFRKRKHQGKYDALCQAAPLPFYRDNNKDKKIDTDGKVYFGYIGLNIHRESLGKIDQLVGKNSAGCGVIQANYDLFMFLINQGIKYWGNSFSYTLINETDFVHEMTTKPWDGSPRVE